MTKNTRGWLAEYDAVFANEPEYVAEGLALRLAEQIVQLMDEKHLSRAELAETMGVSRAYITKVLNAPPNLTLRSIAAVAIALGAKPSLTLVGSKDSPLRVTGRQP